LVFTPRRSWKSLHGRNYNVEWQIEVRETNMTIHIQTHTDNHELPVLLYGRILGRPLPGGS